MSLNLLKCGEFANESESKAVKHLTVVLNTLPGKDPLYLIHNLNFSYTSHKLPDEHDIIAVSRYGIFPVEIKHWNLDYLRNNSAQADKQAEILNAKAKNIKGFLSREFKDWNFGIFGKFLLTNCPGNLKDSDGSFPCINGISCYGLDNWREIFELKNDKPRYTSEQVAAIAAKLVKNKLPPRNAFEKYKEVAYIKEKTTKFRRVANARHGDTNKRAMLYIYDLSAGTGDDIRSFAQREYEALNAIQKSPFSPRILDSFQDASEYPGELYFFSILKPDYPSLPEKMKSAWAIADRLKTACHCFEAIKDFHSESYASEKVLHRNITPGNILVGPDGKPIFTGFLYARVEGLKTITPFLSNCVNPEFSAPEMALNASEKSDIFSLCRTLQVLFKESSDKLAKQMHKLLDEGTQSEPEKRKETDYFLEKIRKLAGQT